MKKSFLFLTLLMLMFTLKSNAQWLLTGNTTTTGIFGTNNAYDIYFYADGNQYMDLQNTTGNFGVGTGYTNPTQLVSIKGGNYNIDASTPQYGFMVADSMVLWLPNVTAPHSHNTWVGYSGNVTGQGTECTYVGYQSGHSTNTNMSQYCSFLGNYSGFKNVGKAQTFIGYQSGYLTTSGSYNTFTGYESGYSDTTGELNAFYGAFSGYGNTIGGFNTCIGPWAGGANKRGYGNTFIGGFSVGSLNDTNHNNCVTLGSYSDVKNNGTNEIAIGAYAVANANNQMELGDSSIRVTIGLSNYAPGDTTRLEINTQHGKSPFMVTSTGTPPTYINHGQGTGWSGLRLDDLTASSTPGTNPGIGVISVDSMGNLIYVQDTLKTHVVSFGSLCGSGSPTVLTGNSEVQLANSNFSFTGNGAGNPLKNNVSIGELCGTAKAKLDVFQHSKDTSSIGILVTNADSGTCRHPVIGIKAVTTNTVTNQVKIAGWFSAPGVNMCCSCDTCSRCRIPILVIHDSQLICYPPPQHAIFVPNGGGNVEIGFKGLCGKPFNLNVNGTIWDLANINASDTTLKTNVILLAGHSNPVSVIQSLKGVSFNYVDTVMTDSGMSGTHYGFIAQQVFRVLPNIVKIDNQGIEGVEYTEIIPWTVEAIKQQQVSIDSLRNRVDTAILGGWGVVVSHGSLGVSPINTIKTDTSKVATKNFVLSHDTNYLKDTIAGSGITPKLATQKFVLSHDTNYLNDTIGGSGITPKLATQSSIPAGWSLHGNSGTSPGTDFIGTTDNEALMFKVDNQESGYLDNISSTYFGYQAGINDCYSCTYDNTGIGFKALTSNTSGAYNVGVGRLAAYSNTSGGALIAIGNAALYKNTSGHNNVGVGSSSGYSNTTGNFLTALGNYAVTNNTTGIDNVGIGNYSMYSNTTGIDNVSIGMNTLHTISGGSGTTVIGSFAGYSVSSGDSNVFVGDSAGYNLASGNNEIFLGYGTEPNHTTESDNIYLGNTHIVQINAKVTGITAYSDRRVKINIQPETHGLDFIMKLNPVFFNYNVHAQDAFYRKRDSIYFAQHPLQTDSLVNSPTSSTYSGQYAAEKILHSGFIAQQVDSAALACGYNFSGLSIPTDTSKSLYGLNYTDFVVPLVKAVQELNGKLDSSYTVNNNQQIQIDSLINALQGIQRCLNKVCAQTHAASQHNNGNDSTGSTTNVQDVTLTSANAPLLYQNIPNPFGSSTKINYYLPEGTMGAVMMFYDNYGNQLKVVELNQTGNGTLNITPDNLSAGIYSYSLVVNNKVIDTKRMILQK